MSPAPQGGLEVERYIGSCLISQSARSSPGKQFLQNKSKKTGGDGTVRQFVLNPRDSVGHAGGPRYSLPPIHGDFYPQHGWAGMPLFCVASNGQRRNRKGPVVNNRATKSPHVGLQNKSVPKCSVDGQGPDGGSRSPLSRLAIHTQGAPLIQAGRYNKIGYNRGTPPLRFYRGADAARRSDPSKDLKTGQNKEPGACDSVSVASDESSANSENSLPRIIKPRKRRKKDRKPPQPQQPTKPGEAVASQNSEVSKTSVSSTPTVNTCKPSVIPKIELPIQQTVENVLSDEADTSLLPRCGDDLPSELEQDDGPASSCQCRYCDPAGVIWDVDQRCYSPFLTPPSPTELKLSYSLRGYDVGSMLRRSWSEPSSSPVKQIQQRTRAYSESQTQSAQPQASQSLEVSSEIITSPNGHRDIEIKFFSSKPNSARQFKVEE